MRVKYHPLLGKLKEKPITIYVNGKPFSAQKGDTIASALLANGIKVFRYTKKGFPRSLFCAIGYCSDCLVKVNGKTNVRACLTKVKEGMKIETDRYRV